MIRREKGERRKQRDRWDGKGGEGRERDRWSGKEGEGREGEGVRVMG